MTTKETKKDTSLIVSLCKDIARHASQLEAENKGVKQSTDRYLELKSLLVSYYLQGEDNFEIILKEIRKSMLNIDNFNEDLDAVKSVRNHALCMFEYFLMLVNEANKIN